jgi:hypothetical protein
MIAFVICFGKYSLNIFEKIFEKIFKIKKKNQTILLNFMLKI